MGYRREYLGINSKLKRDYKISNKKGETIRNKNFLEIINKSIDIEEFDDGTQEKIFLGNEFLNNKNIFLSNRSKYNDFKTMFLLIDNKKFSNYLNKHKIFSKGGDGEGGGDIIIETRYVIKYFIENFIKDKKYKKYLPEKIVNDGLSFDGKNVILDENLFNAFQYAFGRDMLKGKEILSPSNPDEKERQIVYALAELIGSSRGNHYIWFNEG